MMSNHSRGTSRQKHPESFQKPINFFNRRNKEKNQKTRKSICNEFPLEIQEENGKFH